MSLLAVPKWCVTVHLCSDNLISKSLRERSVLKGLLGAELILTSVKG